jgi:NAD(P)-dependent dehydrogenase (short-subunit alcohol dehydrogenase family)
LDGALIFDAGSGRDRRGARHSLWEDLIMEIAGKAAIITGGGSGIGRATAQSLAAHGAAIMIVDVDETMGHESVELIRKAGGKAAFRKADVTNAEQMRRVMEDTIAEFGRLDILHNNAGIAIAHPIYPKTPLEKWRRVLDVDLQAVLLGCQLGYEFMAPRGGGVIVNTASMAGIYPHPSDPVYAAAKGGVVHLTFSVARWARRGVRVNCVCPGIVMTPLVEKLTKEVMDAGGRTAMPANALKPEQIAEVVVNFVRDDNCVGQIVEVRPSGPRVVEPPRPPKRHRQ